MLEFSVSLILLPYHVIPELISLILIYQIHITFSTGIFSVFQVSDHGSLKSISNLIRSESIHFSHVSFLAPFSACLEYCTLLDPVIQSRALAIKPAFSHSFINHQTDYSLCLY